MRILALVSRIPEPRRWGYFIAAVPLILAAIYGWEAGAALPYLVAAAVCAAQFFFPTTIGWWIFFLGYLGASAVYTYLLFADLIRLVRGSSARVLVDASDAVAFAVWVALLVLVTWMLWTMRGARSSRTSSAAAG